MKKLIAMLLVLMMVLAVTACGEDDKDGDKKDSKPTEQQSPTKGEDKPGDTTPTQGETTPAPVDGMEIMDTAREVADKLNLDLNKMMPESFCALRGTNGDDVQYSIVFLFKEELEETDRVRVLDTFNEYLKSIAKDGKIYLDMSGAEWYAEDGREGESQREVVFVKMDGFGFNINVLYANDNAKYTDGKMYPTITVEFMKLVEIGDYRGMTEEQVRSELDSKLAVRIDWVESDTVEENCVVSTNPGAGEKLPLGSTLTVVLSQGSSKYTEVPDVVGMSEVDAKAKLIVAKLDYSTETAYSDTVPAGIVISQSPDSSAGKVEKGTVIKLVISAGEDPE